MQEPLLYATRFEAPLWVLSFYDVITILSSSGAASFSWLRCQINNSRAAMRFGQTYSDASTWDQKHILLPRYQQGSHDSIHLYRKFTYQAKASVTRPCLINGYLSQVCEQSGSNFTFITTPIHRYIMPYETNRSQQALNMA
jgi:hypothetical protein